METWGYRESERERQTDSVLAMTPVKLTNCRKCSETFGRTPPMTRKRGASMATIAADDDPFNTISLSDPSTYRRKEIDRNSDG